MDGFALLLGHLVGDYCVQTDWMAKNKINPYHGEDPWKKAKLKLETRFIVTEDMEVRLATGELWTKWIEAKKNWYFGHFACFVHCLLYTLSVWLFSYQWISWWGLLVCFAVHFPIDRWRLAVKWMRFFGQRDFLTGPCSPWSGIVVDNVWHLLTLYGIWLLSGAS